MDDASTLYSTTTFDDYDTLTLAEPYRCFQVIKSTTNAVGSPQGERLAVRAIIGHEIRKEIIYHTNSMAWYKEKLYLPPPFKLFLGRKLDRVRSSAEPEIQIAGIKYKGWEGMFKMKAEVEVFELDQAIQFAQDGTGRKEGRLMTIRRLKVKREYAVDLAPSGLKLVWKGTRTALKMLDDDAAPAGNGNLKLVNPEGPNPSKVLAVWRNSTDAEILGALTIFDSPNEGSQLLTEEILCSCIAIVCAERLSGRSGRMGGLARSSSKKSEDTRTDSDRLLAMGASDMTLLRSQDEPTG